MTDRLEQASARAARAQALLSHELLIEAYDKIEADLVAAWISTPARDTDGRERCWAAVQANRKHKAYLESVLNDGKLAAAELKQLAEAPDRRKRFGIV
jgi:hypothetical protein